MLLHGLFSSCGLREASLSCGERASHCGDFSCCGAWPSGHAAAAAVAHGLNSCGSQVPEYWLNSCGARAKLFHGMWDRPRSGIELTSAAWAGRFITTEPAGKSSRWFFINTM